MKKMLTENQEMLDRVTQEVLANPKLVKQLALHWRHDHSRGERIQRGPEQDQRIVKHLCDNIDYLLKKGYGGIDFVRGTDWKIYKEFLLKLYAVGGAAAEDLFSRGITALYRWDLMKKNNLLDPKHTNLFNFTSLYRLENLIELYYNEDIEKLSRADQLLSIQRQARMLKIADTPEYEILIPLNHAGAVLAAHNSARWCTAWIDQPRFFQSYNSKGPLVVIEPKRPQHANERYQMHAPTRQFADYKDQGVGGAAIRKRFPNLGNDIAQGFREHGAELKAAGYQPVAGLKQLLTAFKTHMKTTEPKAAEKPSRRRVASAQPPAENP